MIIIDVEPAESTPKGKRSVRQNIWGNWVGYVSGKRFKEFGASERDALEWQVESVILEDVPSDSAAPNWTHKNRIHCWRNYISEELRVFWPTFTQKQRAAIAANAQQIADREEWD